MKSRYRQLLKQETIGKADFYSFKSAKGIFDEGSLGATSWIFGSYEKFKNDVSDANIYRKEILP